MSTLIIKNIGNEGPGTIEDYLKNNSKAYTIVYMKQERPPKGDEFDSLVVLGGPMSVNETDKYPFLIEEEALLKDFIARGKRVLGICLGSQMIAKVLGERVYKGTAPEIGWYDINVTEAAKNDVAFSRLIVPGTSALKVFHWHGETFDIPAGGKRLASSKLYPNQAFKYKDNVYAFQFHMEVNKQMVMEWMSTENVDLDGLKRQTDEIYDSYLKRAMDFYDEFFGK
ncbi:MAG: type 1 glutamine amidotransferase [Nitrospirae bacterium]|nr:type 1 glutamine amidotransferase [Nitrospirota bacterium]MBF0535938.1 type 1 glutamine amidotransferase [Nitrospirota bacterium]MBF0618184.1 type 1 glutamine amidotransferase [Nitrospirota bacterium]